MNDIIDEQVKVSAPARLHMGFMDMHGGLGRSFGSLGLCIDNIATRLTVSHSHRISASGPSAERAKKMASDIFEILSIPGGVHIEVHESIPEHVGLGSGTQLSLAVGTAITRLKKCDVPIKHIARLLGRGDRSGIGIGAFQYGGFLVDGGRTIDSVVPPIIAHHSFPEAWRLLLIFDKGLSGVHGDSEKKAFENAAPMSEDISQHLCRVLLMQVLPALVEEDCSNFGKGITTIQNHIGDYFSKWQGGRYISEDVANVLEWIADSGVDGFGQSSWGPTGFAIYDNETDAYHAAKKAREKWQANSKLEFIVCQARNHMADVEFITPENPLTGKNYTN